MNRRPALIPLEKGTIAASAEELDQKYQKLLDDYSKYGKLDGLRMHIYTC